MRSKGGESSSGRPGVGDHSSDSVRTSVACRMRFSPRSSLVVLTALLAGCAGSEGPTSPTTPTPPAELTVPAINREFRGMWIATVANIDWPSRSGLSMTQQQNELTAILDMAQQTGINAVILQVRASGDALYQSALEPWAKSLVGTQGVDPGYDPLSFAVSQAHARGIELHAWFNPFRAGNLSDSATLAPLHFAKRRPDVTRAWCTQLWFDPGEQAVHDQAIAVITDVVSRYDIDAVHLDDFFYPYPDSRCPGLDFPDSVSFSAYQRIGGTLSRADWRRDNTNRFVQRLYGAVHAAAPTVRVGISPFGIWRPGNPTGITGLDAYASIYADSRNWLQRGWVDYFAPQLYWSINSTGQSFPSLLGWWAQQNSLKRHLWPGLASYRVNDGSTSPYAASEIPSQISLTRQQAGASGYFAGALLYNTTSIKNDAGGVRALLTAGVFAAPALPPPTTWLDNAAPAMPLLDVAKSGSTYRVNFTSGSSKPLSWFLVRWRANGAWSQRTVPASSRSVDITAGGVDGIVVNAIDKVGNASPDVIWRP